MVNHVKNVVADHTCVLRSFFIVFLLCVVSFLVLLGETELVDGYEVQPEKKKCIYSIYI